MNFHISYRPVGGVVRVLFYGAVGFAEKMEATARLVEKYRHRAPLRVLLDLRYAHSKVTLEEQRQFTRYIAEHPVLRRAYIAVLHPRSRCTVPLARRGCLFWHSSREFVAESEAEAWLSRIKGAPRPVVLQSL
ncbi:hypothetical protein [Microbulbifer sp. 2205BS26-8]|uniref:hypothetical protein n=1 Tax=Microbulbifer sp. 2205BS26-8 TaxID=3064386 RepID=UPI00273E8579|nr:hypothetical protein [Microbulbifer sp. 2205BS26-8]MDP5209396.1 hypothetical protein [Microbulbifer sp. 2205BS26-8]